MTKLVPTLVDVLRERVIWDRGTDNFVDGRRRSKDETERGERLEGGHGRFSSWIPFY